MPRQKRLDVTGVIYHVISRGIERRQIFQDKQDRLNFLGRLETVLKETQCKCYAWALMNNHFHLLVRPLKQSLSTLMRRILTGYVGYFNARHRRIGHLFQNRYKAIICQEEVYFLELLRYIHLNPVRAKILQIPSELGRYPWTGHSYILGKRKNNWQEIDEALSHFGSKNREAMRKYQEFIKDGWDIGYRKDLVGGGLLRSAGGKAGIRLLRQLKEKWASDSRILGDGDFVSSMLKDSEEKWETQMKLKGHGWDLDRLCARVESYFNLENGKLISGRRFHRLSLAKGVFCYLGNDLLGASLADMGKYLKITKQAVYQLKERGEAYIDENGNNFTT